MRKVLLSLVAVAAMSGGLTMTSAGAAPLSPSALQPSIIDTNLAEDVQWRRRCAHRWGTSRVVCWRGGWRGWRGRHYWRWSRRW